MMNPKKRKLDLKALEILIPPIEIKEARIILGGSSYGGTEEKNIDEVTIIGPSQPSNPDFDPEDRDEPDFGDNDFDHGDGNGDGNSDNNDNDPVLPNLPDQVEQQLGSMGACVSYAMAFASSYLGQNITGANMAVQIAQQLGFPNLMDVMINGLSIEQATQAIEHFFNAQSLSTISEIIQALENIHPILANTVDEGGVGHEVVIVGYDEETGVFTVADSNTGNYEEVSSDRISISTGVYEISGIK